MCCLEHFKRWCKIFTFWFHSSPLLMVAVGQLFCKSALPPERLHFWISKTNYCAGLMVVTYLLTPDFIDWKLQGGIPRHLYCESGRQAPQLTLSLFSFCCESLPSTQPCVFSHLLMLLSLISVLRNFRDFYLDLKIVKDFAWSVKGWHHLYHSS